MERLAALGPVTTRKYRGLPWENRPFDCQRF